MLTFAIILLVLLLFNVIAWRWGTDSTEKIDSHEWERRRGRHFLI